MSDSENVFVDIVGSDEAGPAPAPLGKRVKESGDSEQENRPNGGARKRSKATQKKSALKEPRKRGRASGSQDLVDGVEEEEPMLINDEDEDEEDIAPAPAKKKPQKDQDDDEYEDFDGASDPGDDDEIEDVGRAMRYQSLLASQPVVSQSQDARSDALFGAGNEGKIEEIQLENFMCHQNLKISLGPQVNFVTGANGSGKSALLVGLTLCLGANTSFVQRANRLGDFVRQGCSTATIRVKLGNRGAEAYKPDEYGRSIIVERKIQRNGSSQYKLKNYKGAVVSTDRSELVPICDRFNIQISNPCIVMMQETSRDFLGNSTSKKKYELFERATQLRTVTDHLNELTGEIAAAIQTQERKQALLPALEKQHEMAKKEHDEIEHLKRVKDEMQSVKAQLVWAHVVEREKAVQECEAELVAKEKTLAHNREQMQKAEERKQKYIEVENELTERLRATGEENDDATIRLTQAREDWQKALANQQRLGRQAKLLPAKMSKLESRIQGLQQRDREQKAAAARDRGEEDRLRFEKQQAEEAQLEKIRTKLGQARDAHGLAQKELDLARQELTRVAPEADSLSRDLRKTESALQNLQRAKDDQDALWGHEMPEVKRLIRDHARQFSKEPIGPLGSHIKLAAGKFQVNGETIDPSRVVEMQLSKLLSSFWCNTYQDAQVLMGLLKTKRISSVKVIVQPFRDQRYADVQMPSENKDYVRVMDTIQCPPGVWNVIVDQLSLEGSVLVPESAFSRATSLLDRQSVRRVLALDGASKSKTRFGDVRQMTAPRAPHMFRLRSNMADQRRELERELTGLKQRLTEAQKRKAQAEQRVRRLDGDLKEHTEAMYRLEDEERHCIGRMTDLNQVVTGEPNENESSLEFKIQELQLSLEKLRSEHRDYASRIADMENEVERLRLEQEAAQKTVDDLFAKHSAIEEQAAEARKKASKMKVLVKKGLGQIEKHAELVETIRVTLEEKRRYLEVGTEGALQAFPERVPVDKTVKELEAMVGGMEKALAKQQKDKGKSIEEIEHNYLQTAQKLKKVRKELKWLADMLRRLGAALKKRNKKIERIRNTVGAEVSHHFNSYLTKKGYEGQLKFIHESSNQSLDVIVRLNKEESSQAQTDTQALSGGESSFSTVALLLSLWEVIDTPFRIMDEFDIFMDAAHRKLSINMLVDFARTVPHRQFIFLSPLDTGDIPRDPDIKAHRLDPPQRGGQADIRQYTAN